MRHCVKKIKYQRRPGRSNCHLCWLWLPVSPRLILLHLSVTGLLLLAQVVTSPTLNTSRSLGLSSLVTSPELPHPYPLTARMKPSPGTRVQTHPSSRPEGRTRSRRPRSTSSLAYICMRFACDQLHVQSLPLGPCGRATPHILLGAARVPAPPRRPSRAAARLAEDPSPLRPLIDGAALRVNPPLIPRKL